MIYTARTYREERCRCIWMAFYSVRQPERICCVLPDATFSLVWHLTACWAFSVYELFSLVSRNASWNEYAVRANVPCMHDRIGDHAHANLAIDHWRQRDYCLRWCGFIGGHNVRVLHRIRGMNGSTNQCLPIWNQIEFCLFAGIRGRRAAREHLSHLHQRNESSVFVQTEMWTLRIGVAGVSAENDAHRECGAEHESISDEHCVHRWHRWHQIGIIHLRCEASETIIVFNPRANYR